MDPILQLDACALRERLADGALRVVELAHACLARIAQREPEVRAWAWHDRDFVLRQAEALDAHRAAGRPLGPLHGLPVGIKDIIDTEGIPTENGTVIDAGRVPTADAFVVARLRQAGAIVMGKTVTSELAFRTAGATRNPLNPDHTPGGSSSGSAAAVADRMVPLAIGTQTAGSVVRPASFCGVVGYKPTFGAIPRRGVLMQSASLDTVGVFANTVEDAALLAETLFGYDAADVATRLAPSPRLLQTARAAPPVKPALAFVRQPAWDAATLDLHAAFAELTGELGEACDEVELPAAFARAAHLRQIVHQAEQAVAYHRYESRARDQLSEPARASIDAGRRVLAQDYLAARDWACVLNDGLEAIFDRYDAIVTPAAPGPAPAGLASTGDPAFNGIWTYCGTPAITLPLLTAENGLPMGVQLVGRRGDDARLLRTARWLVGRLRDAN